MEVVNIVTSEWRRRRAAKKVEDKCKCDFWRAFGTELDRLGGVGDLIRLGCIIMFLALSVALLCYISVFFTAITILWQ